MTECTNCGTELRPESVTWQLRDREGSPRLCKNCLDEYLELDEEGRDEFYENLDIPEEDQ